MWLAFYKAETGNFFDKLIGWWDRPNKWKFWSYKGYSHVEIVFSNNTTCYSSSPRDGGTRWVEIPDISLSNHWSLVKLENVPHTEDELIKICNEQNGKKYDWLALIFNFVIITRMEDPKKWFCSEFCGKYALGLDKPYRYSPNDLAKKFNLI